jgi:hypothetical protein
MQKIIIYSFIIIAGLASCDYLDVVPEKVGTVEYAFGDRQRAIGYLATCYSFIPLFENEGSNPGRTVGPESFQYQAGENNGNRITRLGNNITNPYMNYWDGGGGVASGTVTVNGIKESQSKDMFTALRCCNIFLENIHHVPDLNVYEKDMWAAEVKFLKAFYHWWLVQLYGPIPVVRENLPVDASPEAVQIYREPIEDAISYVIELLNEAIENLPDVVDTEITDLGRITKPIAMALKAKVLVFHASPFFNGNTGYANFGDKSGNPFFPADYDPQKWVNAAEACLEAIKYCESLGYSLFKYEKPLGAKMTDSTMHVLTPSSLVTSPWNKELIWASSKADVTTVQQNCMPMLTGAFRQANLRSRFSPTMSSIETYYSSHGVPIEEDNDWIAGNWYNDRYHIAQGDDNHHFVIEKDYPTARLHLNREYRFYGSVAFDGGLWFGAGVTNASELNQITIQAKGAAVAGKQGIERYSITGYLIKKLVSVNTAAPNNSFSAQRYSWPVLRLADLYLLYAEALNETMETPNSEVYKYINEVRARAGLEFVEDSWRKYSVNSAKYTTRDGMRDIIHQERMIELAYEGHYYFDIRRWSGGTKRGRYDIMTEMNNPIKGWNIDGETAEDYYHTRIVATPKFSFRDYLWPIKEAARTKNGNLIQNPGW